MRFPAYTISEMGRDSQDRNKRRSWFRDRQMPGAVDMEAETIIYYHPITEQSHQRLAAKRHWWQDAMLRERPLPEQRLCPGGPGSSFTLVDCPVPPFSYKRKAWKPEELSECMKTVLHRTSGMADVYLHPQVMTWVSGKYADRWETCRETMEMLFSSLLSVYASQCLRKQGQVTVLLGAPGDTRWQMEMSWRLLEPYLSRVNSLVFYYVEMEKIDIWEELSDCLETYYYEYGLVPQLCPYQTQKRKAGGAGPEGAGVILDCGAGNPGILSGRQSVYVDMASSQEKEQACTRRNGQMLYVSPLKYLDTMVKNSYDRLVH